MHDRQATSPKSEIRGDMHNVSLLSHRIEKIHGRLSELYQTAITASPSASELLPTTLVELGIVSEALQVVANELIQQNEKLTTVKQRQETEQQRYKNLCELLSDGYFVTNSSLLIQEMNHTFAEQLNLPTKSIVGRSILDFLNDEDYSIFKNQLTQIQQRSQLKLSIRLKRHPDEFFNASMTVNVFCDRETNHLQLQWLVQDITERKRAESALQCSHYNPCHDRPIQTYAKGEMIPLEPDKIWLVVQGVVKLTTMSDRGEEMLVGLVRDSMVFGASLTSLQTYEALALSPVQLVSIPLTEISQSPQLSQFLLPLISQRLRQTERFLSTYGQLHVEDRLYHLLELLKQEIAQPMDDGLRLCVRFTHQDFARACCTTRVTVTRLLGKLQQEGKITFDSHNHLVFVGI